jgi:hypothetical protein
MVKYVKKALSTCYFDLIISACPPFGKVSNSRFDAELNELQNAIKYFLAIDCYPKNSAKVPKNETNFM